MHLAATILELQGSLIHGSSFLVLHGLTWLFINSCDEVYGVMRALQIRTGRPKSFIKKIPWWLVTLSRFICVFPVIFGKKSLCAGKKPVITNDATFYLIGQGKNEFVILWIIMLQVYYEQNNSRLFFFFSCWMCQTLLAFSGTRCSFLQLQ